MLPRVPRLGSGFRDGIFDPKGSSTYPFSGLNREAWGLIAHAAVSGSGSVWGLEGL